jgi:dihydropteroate synthase
MEVKILKLEDREVITEEFKKIGVHPKGIELMIDKALFRVIKVDGIDTRAANLVKQKMLSVGGDAAVPEYVSRFKRGRCSIIIFGTELQYMRLAENLKLQPYGLKLLSEKISSLLKDESSGKAKEVILPRHKIRINKGSPLIMGILNVTPDSFYDGGRYYDIGKAVAHAEYMISEGAQIIDVGGESSRPGASPVAEKEEISRVVPVIKSIAKRTNIIISVDTYKAEVAKRAIEAGAEIVNDISALRLDKNMVKVVSKYKVGVILMHMRGTPRTMQKNIYYRDVVSDIRKFLLKRIEYAIKSGIDKSSIMTDPGIGFGKTVEHNLQILRDLSEFKSLGFPLVLGTSRKSFIGKILGSEDRPLPPEERLPGSLATYAYAVLNGVDILRVHDVRETREVIKILSSIIDINNKRV